MNDSLRNLPIHNSPANDNARHMNQEFRVYSFVNALYMKEIQWGIQIAHGVAELFNKAHDRQEGRASDRDVLFHWSISDKTIIVLNGGIEAELNEKAGFLSAINHQLDFEMPWTTFNEDEASLGGSLTNVICVVPAQYFDAVSKNTLLKLIFKGEVLDPAENHRAIESYDDEDYFYVVNGEVSRIFTAQSPDGQFIRMMKSCALAGR